MKLGRRPRTFNPRVPHMSSLVGGRILSPVQPSVDWTGKLPASLGMMKNDVLGCCTSAGIYHTIQVWTANSQGAIDSEPDSNVELVYAESCGYEPGNPATDLGGVEQDVLSYWVNEGVPVYPTVGSVGDVFNKLTAFFEVDPRHLDDVRRTIADCGVCYIGIQMPVYILQNPTKVWDEPGTGDDASIEGGHCVIQAAYDVAGKTFKLVSWGQVFTMTEGFFQRSTDEAYGPVDADWVNNQGTTPLGLSLGEIEAQMAAIKA